MFQLSVVKSNFNHLPHVGDTWIDSMRRRWRVVEIVSLSLHNSAVGERHRMIMNAVPAIAGGK